MAEQQRGSEVEGTSAGREQGSSPANPRRRVREPSWPGFKVTVDSQGFFHVAPLPGGRSFRSVGEALAAAETMLLDRRYIGSRQADDRPRQERFLWLPWYPSSSPPPYGPIANIYGRRVRLKPEPPRFKPWSSWEYHITLRDGLFYAHPSEVGGPFHSLGEAAAAIKGHTTWVSATKLLTEDYYLTLKDGLYHVHPNDGMGGPFKRLKDATAAIRIDRRWKQEQQEKGRRAREFLDNLDPAVYLARMKELIDAIKTGKRDPQPVKSSCSDEASLEHEDCDPDISEGEMDRVERFLERRNAIREGMKLMKSEVLEAFEFYKESTKYKGPKYEFVNLEQQCLIYDNFPNSYHHYNFTMKRKSSFYLSKKAKRSLKRPSRRGCEYQLFFAQVKSAEKGKQIICKPLRSGEDGHCFGCKNVGIKLRHPASGGYEVGHEDSGFPFDSDTGSDY